MPHACKSAVPRGACLATSTIARFNETRGVPRQRGRASRSDQSFSSSKQPLMAAKLTRRRHELAQRERAVRDPKD